MEIIRNTIIVDETAAASSSEDLDSSICKFPVQVECRSFKLVYLPPQPGLSIMPCQGDVIMKSCSGRQYVSQLPDPCIIFHYYGVTSFTVVHRNSFLYSSILDFISLLHSMTNTAMFNIALLTVRY